MALPDMFPEREHVQPRMVNFVIDAKPVDDTGTKAVVVEIDPGYEVRVGDLFVGVDGRTQRRYALEVYDVGPAYAHGELQANMLDNLRQRPDKEIDDQSFAAVCKNAALCTLLGELVDGELAERGYRPNKYTTRVASAGDEIETLLVAGWEEGAPLGYYRKGHEVRRVHPVYFSTLQLVGKRFAIFAQTGGGKSTAMRWLLDWHTRQMDAEGVERKIGFMVDDFKLEYPFDGQNERGETVPGLVTTLGDVAKRKLVILTARPETFDDEQKQQVRDIVPAQIPLDSLTLSSFADIAGLSDAQTNLVRLIENSPRTTPQQFFTDLFAVDAYGLPDRVIWGKTYGRMFFSDKGKRKVEKGQEIDSDEDIQSGLRDRLEYIWRAAQRLGSMPFMTRTRAGGDCLPRLIGYLRDGCTIIVDKSGMEDHQRELFTLLLLTRIFKHNQEQAASGGNMIPVIYAVEEAQYLLADKKVADPDSIFAKIAFTGRSYQIGLIAITQRPQGVDKDLLGQFDGALVLPLEHANDFKHLADAMPALARYRNDLATASVGAGVLAYGKPKRVVSIQVRNYTENEVGA